MATINVLQNGGNIKTIDFTPYGGIDGFLAVSGGGQNPDVIRLRKVVPWLNKAIRMTANSVSQLPYTIEAGSTEVEPDTAWGAVKNPQTLISLTAASLCGGAAYWKIETTSRAILSAQYLAPQTITPNFDSNGELINFTRAYNTTRETLSPEQVIYFWLPDDTIENGAAQITPIGNAMLAAGLLAAMDTTIKQYGDNGFIPPMFAVADGMQKPEAERAENVLSAFMRGAWARVVKIVNAKSLVPVPVGAGMEDLKGSYSEITSQQIKNIAAAFGIPNSTFLSDENSYATATADAKLWYSSSEFVSIYQTVEDSLTDQLWSRFGWSMQYDPEKLEAFQQEETDKSGAVSTLSSTITASPEASLIAMDILGYDLTDEQIAAIKTMGIDEPTEPTTSPTPAVQPDPMELPTSEDNAIATELMAWRKFADRPRKRQFETKAIPPALALRISAGLKAAATPEEIDAVFDAAIVELPLIRLAKAIERDNE